MIGIADELLGHDRSPPKSLVAQCPQSVDCSDGTNEVCGQRMLATDLVKFSESRTLRVLVGYSLEDAMTKHEHSYLLARAEEEIEKAQQSADPRAVSAHFQLAELYLDSAYGEPDEAVNSE